MTAYQFFYDSLPHHVQVCLIANSITNKCADGEILLNIRLTEHDLWDILVNELAEAISVVVTNSSIDQATSVLETLTDKASHAQPTKFYSPAQLEVLRHSKRARATATTEDLSSLVRKWRHWKTGC